MTLGCVSVYSAADLHNGDVGLKINDYLAHFDARGAECDGKAYVNSYGWLLRMQGGEIVEAYAFFNTIAFDDLRPRVAPASRP